LAASKGGARLGLEAGGMKKDDSKGEGASEAPEALGKESRGQGDKETWRQGARRHAERGDDTGSRRPQAVAGSREGVPFSSFWWEVRMAD